MGAKSWEVTDAFWSRVEPLIPARRQRDPEATFVRKPGGGRKPKPARMVFEAIVFVLRTGCQWKALPAERFGSASAVCTSASWNGRKPVSSRRYGVPGWRSTTRWKASPGAGKASTGR